MPKLQMTIEEIQFPVCDDSNWGTLVVMLRQGNVNVSVTLEVPMKEVDKILLGRRMIGTAIEVKQQGRQHGNLVCETR